MAQSLGLKYISLSEIFQFQEETFNKLHLIYVTWIRGTTTLLFYFISLPTFGSYAKTLVSFNRPELQKINI